VGGWGALCLRGANSLRSVTSTASSTFLWILRELSGFALTSMIQSTEGPLWVLLSLPPTDAFSAPAEPCCQPRENSAATVLFLKVRCVIRCAHRLKIPEGSPCGGFWGKRRLRVASPYLAARWLLGMRRLGNFRRSETPG